MQIKEFGVQWMDLSSILKKLQVFMSNEDFIMVGIMTIMSQVCLSLLLMEQFQYHFLMSLDVFKQSSSRMGLYLSESGRIMGKI